MPGILTNFWRYSGDKRDETKFPEIPQDFYGFQRIPPYFKDPYDFKRNDKISMYLKKLRKLEEI